MSSLIPEIWTNIRPHTEFDVQPDTDFNINTEFYIRPDTKYLGKYPAGSRISGQIPDIYTELYIQPDTELWVKEPARYRTSRQMTSRTPDIYKIRLGTEFDILLDTGKKTGYPVRP